MKKERRRSDHLAVPAKDDDRSALLAPGEDAGWLVLRFGFDVGDRFRGERERIDDAARSRAVLVVHDGEAAARDLDNQADVLSAVLEEHPSAFASESECSQFGADFVVVVHVCHFIGLR